MSFDLLDQWKPVVVLASLALFWLWETVFPFFPFRNRARHDLRNLVIAGINVAVLVLVFSGLVVWAAEVASIHQLGLLRVVGLSQGWLVLGSLLVLDCWVYWWHRINHRIPFFWRFHRMHHSDPAVDMTTAARFHVGEIIFSSAIRIVLIPVIGIPLEAIILYDIIQLPVIAFHHANIALSPATDRMLRLAIVTPFMHKVHHSREKNETDSNFSSILSAWDRIFGSYVERKEYASIGFGLQGFDSAGVQSVTGLLRTPLLPGEQGRGT